MISMKINHFSNVLSMNMDCRLLLPDDTKTDKEQFKVLWLCHGGSGDENEWLYYSTVAALTEERHIAIVIVNANDSCFVDMPYGKNYGTYIGKELPEILWQMFPCLSTKREDNYISGLSNGGYGCFIVGLKNRERFGAIGAFSAGDKADAVPKPFEPGTMNPRVRMFGQEDIHETEYSMKYLARKTAKEPGEKPRIYHACGSLDPWLSLNLSVRECMEAISCPEYDYVYHQMEGMGHEWKFWDVEIRNFLDYVGIMAE
ncbi:MAG: alpha/beta hydrolase-fold protein [Thermoflexaceae bacterium]|nr:alpha/beta hydrolase-fold protein [Thermoflexaceae bacterium]